MARAAWRVRATAPSADVMSSMMGTTCRATASQPNSDEVCNKTGNMLAAVISDSVVTRTPGSAEITAATGATVSSVHVRGMGGSICADACISDNQPRTDAV